MKKLFSIFALLFAVFFVSGQSITLAVADDVVPIAWTDKGDITASPSHVWTFDVPALRVLTDDERQTLLESSTYKERCQWSARNYAVFVLGETTITSASTNTAKKKAVKDFIIAEEIYLGGVGDQNIAERYLNLSKGRTFDLGAAPVDETTLLAVFTSAVLEEFNSAYFDILADHL